MNSDLSLAVNAIENACRDVPEGREPRDWKKEADVLLRDLSRESTASQMLQAVRVGLCLADLDDNLGLATRVLERCVASLPPQIGELLDFVAEEAPEDGKVAPDRIPDVPNATKTLAVNILWTLAELYGRQKHQLQKAEALLTTASCLDPSHTPSLGSRAVVLHRRRCYRADVVQTAFNRYLHKCYAKGCSPHPTILTQLGHWRKSRGDATGAEQWYRQALVVDEGNADALGALAVLLQAQTGRAGEAERLYERAIYEHPHHVVNLGNYGLFCADVKGDAAKAEDLYNRALELDPAHANTLYNNAVLQENVKGNIDEAMDLYRRAIDARPLHAFALHNYAVLLEDHRRDFDAAETHFRLAVEAAPSDVTARRDYATFLWKRRQDLEAARDVFEDALLVDASDSGLLQRYVDFLTSCASSLRDKTLALERAAQLRRTLYERGVTDSDV